MKPHLMLGGALLSLAAGAALAQSAAAAPAGTVQPQNVLQLSASGQVQVMQDLLTMSLAAVREGTDAAAVQAELRKAVDAALAEVKKSAQPGQLDVRSGAFNVHPSYGRDGKISGWQGRAELLLEGRDFPRVTQAAARAATMTVGNMAFGLSREARARADKEAQTIAIEAFKAKAADIARAFGFGNYTLREVSIDSSDSGPQPRMYATAKTAGSLSGSAPVPVEPGQSTVQVNVSGTVQAR